MECLEICDNSKVFLFDLIRYQFQKEWIILESGYFLPTFHGLEFITARSTSFQFGPLFVNRQRSLKNLNTLVFKFSQMFILETFTHRMLILKKSAGSLFELVPSISSKKNRKQRVLFALLLNRRNKKEKIDFKNNFHQNKEMLKTLFLFFHAGYVSVLWNLQTFFQQWSVKQKVWRIKLTCHSQSKMMIKFHFTFKPTVFGILTLWRWILKICWFGFGDFSPLLKFKGNNRKILNTQQIQKYRIKRPKEICSCSSTGKGLGGDNSVLVFILFSIFIIFYQTKGWNWQQNCP